MLDAARCSIEVGSFAADAAARTVHFVARIDLHMLASAAAAAVAHSSLADDGHSACIALMLDAERLHHKQDPMDYRS